MILLLGQTVNLIPDKTVIWQLAIFLAVVAVLSFFVFKPTLKLLDERRRNTVVLQQETDKFMADADSLEDEYNEQIFAARREGHEAERNLLNLGEEEARKIVGEAKEKQKGEIEKVRDEITSVTAQSKQELSKNVGDFSRMIVSKVLGKNG